MRTRHLPANWSRPGTLLLAVGCGCVGAAVASRYSVEAGLAVWLGLQVGASLLRAATDNARAVRERPPEPPGLAQLRGEFEVLKDEVADARRQLGAWSRRTPVDAGPGAGFGARPPVEFWSGRDQRGGPATDGDEGGD